VERPRPLSVPEVAAELNASDAYVRRLLISQRLYGIKVGPVWAIYREDLEAFRRLRRPPGRPRKPVEGPDKERSRGEGTFDRGQRRTSVSRHQSSPYRSQASSIPWRSPS
jgi:excisionase family DNA binding protein